MAVVPFHRLQDAIVDPLSLAASPDSTVTHPLSELIGARLSDPEEWFQLGGSLLSTLLILLVAWILIRLTSRAARGWVRRFEDLPAIDPKRQRALTIGQLLESSVRYVVWPLAFIMMLAEFGINVGALIATAGVAGLAIGFGAQTLVRDVISGIFLLFDESLHVGNLIRFNGESGSVEYIGVRMIRVRKFDGEVLMVPAGELRVFGNRSLDYARVLAEVGVTYEQNLDDLIRETERVANDWFKANAPIMLDEAPEVQAVVRLDASAVTLRVVVRVVPGEQFAAQRDLFKRLKLHFDQLGIEIPFPRQTVYMRQETALPPTTIPDTSGDDPK